MNKHFKIGLPYILCVVMGILLYFKWNQPVKTVKSDPIKAVAEVVKTYEDKFSQKHAVIEKNANTIKPSDLDDPAKVPGFVDTASQALKIARAELDQVTKLNFVIEQKYLAAQKTIDSLGNEIFEYKGKYLWARFMPKSSVDFPNGYFNYRYDGGFTIADHTDEKKFLGIRISKKSYTDFFFSDTSAYLSGTIKRLTIEKAQSPKIFQLNGYSQYDVQANTFAYGPSLRLEKGPFDLDISQVYWPRLNTWSTIVNASFTIKSF